MILGQNDPRMKHPLGGGQSVPRVPLGSLVGLGNGSTERLLHSRNIRGCNLSLEPDLDPRSVRGSVRRSGFDPSTIAPINLTDSLVKCATLCTVSPLTRMQHTVFPMKPNSVGPGTKIRHTESQSLFSLWMHLRQMSTSCI
jgi:hypothetical protein